MLGRKIEIVAADHQNKADLSANIARDMLDNQGVEMLFDVAASATALAAGEIAKARNKIVIFNGPGSIRLSNEACGPYTVHYVFDTFGQANVTGLAAVKQGLDSWYFLTADYAFGQDLEKDTTNVVLKSGGKVLGSRAASAQHVGFLLLPAAGAGFESQGDRAGQCRRRHRQRHQAGGRVRIDEGRPESRAAARLRHRYRQHRSGNRAGPAAFGSLLLGPQRRHPRVFQALQERIKRVPTSAQAGVYSSVTHYLKAVKAAGTTDSAAVIKIMKETPINDMFAKNGKIREDGRMVHDMYLFEVKKPSESKARWDYYKLLDDDPRQRGVPVAGSLALSAGEEVEPKSRVIPGHAKRTAMRNRHRWHLASEVRCFALAPAMTEPTINQQQRKHHP